MEPIFTTESELWKYNGDKASWFFLTVSKALSKQIKGFQSEHLGFGSVRVEVTLGSSTWKTSVFPSKELESYVLPVKKQVRTKEGLKENDLVKFTIKLI